MEKEWDEQSEDATKCGHIFRVFDPEGAGVLKREQFNRLVVSTIGSELEGLYEHMLQLDEGKQNNGIGPAQIYKFVYHAVAPGRRQDGLEDPKQMIRADYDKLCGVQSTPSAQRRTQVLASHLKT